MAEENWDLLQNFAFQCALNQPETMRLVVSIFLRAKFIDKHSIDSAKLARILNSIIETSGPVPGSGNVGWAIWAALLFGCKLTRDAAGQLAETENSVIACLACEANDRGLWPGRFSLPAMRRLLTSSNSLYDEHWLFAYESARNSWIGRSPQSLGSDPCFRYLLAQDVAFFQPQTDRELKRRLRAAVKSKNLPPSDADSDDDSVSEDMFDLWWLRDDSD